MFGAPRPGRRAGGLLGRDERAADRSAARHAARIRDVRRRRERTRRRGGFIVYDDTACMVDVASVLSRFLYVESCGQCPPCKLGTGAITSALDDIAAGRGSDASLETLNHWLSVVADGNRCFLPVEEQQLIGSILRTFPDDFDAHLQAPPRTTTPPSGQSWPSSPAGRPQKPNPGPEAAPHRDLQTVTATRRPPGPRSFRSGCPCGGTRRRRRPNTARYASCTTMPAIMSCE